MSNPKHTTDGEPPDDGHWDGPAPKPIDPATGQHGAYWVLSAEERAKGFVRPVRLSYKHVGPPLPGSLRDLTEEEQERHRQWNYVKFEEYDEPPGGSSLVGRFWTQAQLDRLTGGCGSITTMPQAIAETYARQPDDFYSKTFCCACRDHLPVGPTGEFVWEGTNERVGT